MLQKRKDGEKLALWKNKKMLIFEKEGSNLSPVQQRRMSVCLDASLAAAELVPGPSDAVIRCCLQTLHKLNSVCTEKNLNSIPGASSSSYRFEACLHSLADNHHD